MATEQSRKYCRVEALPSPARGGSLPQQRGEVRLHRRWQFLAILVLLLALIPTLVSADEMDDRVRAISKQLRCPVCAGESVADSNAQVSVQMRGIIREKLEAGESEAQIKAYFVERYGPSILLSPEAKGFTLGVWVAPVVALFVGLGIVVAVLRSWSRRGEPVAPAPAPVRASALPADDDDRLERELEQFRRTGSKVGG